MTPGHHFFYLGNFIFCFWSFYPDLKLFASLEALGADLQTGTVGKFRPLEIGLFAIDASRIVFGRTNDVGVSSDHLAVFIANRARLHSSLLLFWFD